MDVPGNYYKLYFAIKLQPTNCNDDGNCGGVTVFASIEDSNYRLRDSIELLFTDGQPGIG